MTHLEKCKTCQLYLTQQKTCQLMIPQMQGKISPDDYCSKYMHDMPICKICGTGVMVPFIETKDDEVHIYCVNCLSQR